MRKDVLLSVHEHIVTLASIPASQSAHGYECMRAGKRQVYIPGVNLNSECYYWNTLNEYTPQYIREYILLVKQCHGLWGRGATEPGGPFCYVGPLLSHILDPPLQVW